jgi:hypothetical protein
VFSRRILRNTAKTDLCLRGTSIEVMAGMRKRYRVLLLAALTALVVPVGFALSLESAPVATQLVYTGMLPGASAPPSLPFTMPDSAKLFGVGTLLIGLAAMVRRTN